MRTASPSKPFAHLPGVKYPEEKAPKRYPLPAGCPKFVRTLRAFGKWVFHVNLYPNLPSYATLKRWKKCGFIVTRRGAGGIEMIDVGASLQLLTPSKQH